MNPLVQKHSFSLKNIYINIYLSLSNVKSKISNHKNVCFRHFQKPYKEHLFNSIKSEVQKYIFQSYFFLSLKYNLSCKFKKVVSDIKAKKNLVDLKESGTNTQLKFDSVV